MCDRHRESLDLDFPLSKVHAAVNGGDPIGEAHRLEPVAQPVECVPMLREDDQLLAAKTLIEQHFTECRELRVLVLRENATREREQASTSRRSI